MKRIVMLLTVVALMVGMLAMSVTPAFAAWYETSVPGVFCRTGDSPQSVGPYPAFIEIDRNTDGYICFTWRGSGTHVHGAYYDNHQP